ncbi:hypothetical protein Hdeb2414_s0007g00237651 [Helianthus debilis subsp. tardiflorus]
MSTREHHEDSSEKMAVGLPPLKWPRETFDNIVQNFKFPDSWGARYPDEGQTAADAPAGYITVFWDYFAEVVSLYVVAYKREGGKMATIPKKADEELWYLQIVKNFALPRDGDLSTQPPTGAGLAPTVVKKPKAEPRDTVDIPASNPDEPIDLE